GKRLLRSTKEACKINISSTFQAIFVTSISLPPSRSRMYKEAAQSTNLPTRGFSVKAFTILPFRLAGFAPAPRHFARNTAQFRSSNFASLEFANSFRTRQFVV